MTSNFTAPEERDPSVDLETSTIPKEDPKYELSRDMYLTQAPHIHSQVGQPPLSQHQQPQLVGMNYYNYGPGAPAQYQLQTSSAPPVSGPGPLLRPSAYQGTSALGSEYAPSVLPPLLGNSGENQGGGSAPTVEGRAPRNENKLTTTFWEDENTICYQVEVRGVAVSRRLDTHYINGTKLLNVVGMTRGRRDGILKSEKTRYVVKIGAMNLKGVWIPFDRAVQLATSEGVFDLLYPLFVKDIKAYYEENVLRNPNSVDLEPSTPRVKRKRTLKRRSGDQTLQRYPQNYPQNSQYPQYYSQQQPVQPQYYGYHPSYSQTSSDHPGQQYNLQYSQLQQRPLQQQQYSPYQSLLPQQQEYVQQYYNYYRQFQPQPPPQQGSSSQYHPSQPQQQYPSERQ